MLSHVILCHKNEIVNNNENKNNNIYLKSNILKDQ